MHKKLIAGVALGAFLLAAASAQWASAESSGDGGGDGDGHSIRHVLLISVDGMHAVDYANCANGISGINGGATYCPNLKALGGHGVTYLNGSTSKPSDSFPGLMSIVTGGSPRTMGIFYDAAYDRSLSPPAKTTGNGVTGAPGLCPSQIGTRTEYEEGIDVDQTQLDGGGGIDPTRLIRDPADSCKPIYPWNFVRVNTVFGVAHHAGLYTAWSDKHLAYRSVSGPEKGDTVGKNVDDYYAPEINSTEAALPQVTIMSCSPLPDNTAFAAGDDYTGSFQNIQCYDSLKVQAILNEIDGKHHDGTGHAPIPAIFGMNFQAVSIGQKLVYTDGTSVAAGYSLTGGYLDSFGTPSNSLLKEIEFVDNSIGLMVSELKKRHELDSTLIIITAKHGQSPIDPNRVLRIPADNGGMPPSEIISSLLPDSEINQIGPTEDDVSLLWLENSTPAETATAVGMLQSASPTNSPLVGGYNGGQIFWGPSLDLMFNDPATDPRTPDIVVAPNVGVIYTGKKKKVSEHGGFAHDDTNVIMLLANPDFSPESVNTPVQTAQVAPTILKALGLDPHSLQAVQLEHTQVLPGLSLPY